MTFSENLKDARKAAGFTQQTLSLAFGIPKRTIEQWETGDRTPPAYVQRLIIDALRTDETGETAETTLRLVLELVEKCGSLDELRAAVKRVIG